MPSASADDVAKVDVAEDKDSKKYQVDNQEDNHIQLDESSHVTIVE